MLKDLSCQNTFVFSLFSLLLEKRSYLKQRKEEHKTQIFETLRLHYILQSFAIRLFTNDWTDAITAGETILATSSFLNNLFVQFCAPPTLSHLSSYSLLCFSNILTTKAAIQCKLGLLLGGEPKSKEPN